MPQSNNNCMSMKVFRVLGTSSKALSLPVLFLPYFIITLGKSREDCKCNPPIYIVLGGTG